VKGKIDEFCQTAVNDGWHWEDKSTVDSSEVANNPFHSGSSSHSYSDVKSDDGQNLLVLTIAVNQQSCAMGEEYKVDFKSMGVVQCGSNFNVIVLTCESAVSDEGLKSED
jgi:hypothetical protein